MISEYRIRNLPFFFSGESCTSQWEDDSETVSLILISPPVEFLLNLNKSYLVYKKIQPREKEINCRQSW